MNAIDVGARCLLLLGVLVVGACANTAPPPPPPPPAPPWPASIVVPEIRTVGDLPPVARRVVLAMDGSGRLSVGSRDATLEDVRAALRDAATARGPESVDALLAVDGSVPWGAAARLVIECAIAGVDRVFYAARPADGGEPGAIALFLPSAGGVVPGEHPQIQVYVRDGWPPSDVLALHDVFRDVAGGAPPGVSLDAAPTTPMEVILRIADVAALEHVASFAFVATAVPPLPLGETLEEVSALRTQSPARRVVVFDRDLDRPSLLVPHAERVRGQYAGFWQ